VPALANTLLDEGEHPLVREHAAWALGRFAVPAARRALERAWRGESGKRAAANGSSAPVESGGPAADEASGPVDSRGPAADEGLQTELTLALDRAA
jgi:hypothetical protein